MSKWPFFAGDVLLLTAAFSIFRQTTLPLGPTQLSFVCLCVTLGAVFGILPFLFEYLAAAKLAESSALTTVVSQMDRLDKLSRQISGATGQWQTVQEQADKTASLAQGIADRTSGEVSAFTKFMRRANEDERSTLRLEVEKLHRAERDWVQVLVRMLDHTYALYQGAVRSGRADVIAQLGNFQADCRDAARRVGLAPFAPQESERFNSERHQLLEAENKPAADAVIAETLATGYTFQGRLLRPALVRLQNAQNGVDSERESAEPAKADSGTEQTQFPLETAQVE